MAALVNRDEHGIWLSVPVENGWQADYRLDVERSRLVFGELRLRPSGYTTRGGIDAALLRSIRVGEHRTLLLDELRQAITADPAALVGLELERGILASVADVADALVAEVAERGKERDDLYYARIASRYADLVAAGTRRPTPVIAEEIGRPRSYVTATVGDARKRGLLTKTTRGRVGGELTAKARRLLERAERRES